MTFKLQAQSGSCRHSMWCGAAEHTGMPSPSEQDDWGACTYFGAVPRRMLWLDMAKPSRDQAAVIEGSLGILGDSDLSRSSTLSGQRSKRGAPYGVSCGREVSKAYPPAWSYNPRPTGAATMATRAFEKVRPHRPRHFGVPETNFGNLPQ